jgi:TolB-like protein/DNA-binding winged helix-turn-helix (wHTH) protein
MQEVPQERSDADATPSGKQTSRVRFAGLVFDLTACTLARESGEPIPLTGGEFRLLRLFVSRPGRALSRDTILEAVANRPLELFDRSVDAFVGRLRRKIEPDPKAPRLIVTVPGEGYRFDGLAPLRSALADGAGESYPQVADDETAPEAARPTDPAQPSGAPPPPSAATAPKRPLRRLAVAAALVTALLVVGAYVWRSGLATRFMGTAAEDKLANAPRLSIVVLPFENLSGDKEQDYFADGITDDLTTDLSHLRDSFVIARGTAFTFKGKPIDAKEIGRELGVRYALEGSVRRLGEKIEVNAQLVSAESGAHVWLTVSRASAASSANCRSKSSHDWRVRSAWSWSKPKRCGRCANGPTIPTQPTSPCARAQDTIQAATAGRSTATSSISASARLLSTRKTSARWSIWRTH